MKTITEFPGTLLRQAIVFRKQQRPAGSPDAPPSAPAEAPQDATPPSAPAANPETAALGAALGVEGQRLARLMEALAVVGDRIDTVNRVRVFGGEEQPQGGRKQGDFYYVVDLIPRPQEGGRRNRDRPGGRDRGERDRGGPGRGPGGREREPPRSEVPAGGAGWTLARAPDDPRDARGGRRGDQRGRPGPGGERRGPGARAPGRGGSGGGRGPGGQSGGPGAGGRDPGR